MQPPKTLRHRAAGSIWRKIRFMGAKIAHSFHITLSALWKKPQTRVRYSGMRPSLPHFRSMPNSSEVVRAMSNPHASSEGRTLSGVAAGFSLRDVCSSPSGAMEARSDVGERSAAVEPFHFEQARFEAQPLGADQPSGLRDGNAARFGDDLCCDEQRRGVACEVFVHVESERRASPAPPVIGTGAAVAADSSGVAEPGDVFGCGELGGEVPGGVSERRIHAAKIVVFFRTCPAAGCLRTRNLRNRR